VVRQSSKQQRRSSRESGGFHFLAWKSMHQDDPPPDGSVTHTDLAAFTSIAEAQPEPEPVPVPGLGPGPGPGPVGSGSGPGQTPRTGPGLRVARPSFGLTLVMPPGG
jgi:hypothetical protein